MNLPTEELPRPIAEYLGRLELALKSRAGVSVEDALSDAREHLCRMLGQIDWQQQDITETIAIFEREYGKPEAVADAYVDATPPVRGIPGYAPNWRICCTSCGRSAPASKAGVVRIGAISKEKYVLGWCRGCSWFRRLRLQADLQQTNITTQLGMQTTAESYRAKTHRTWLALIIFAIAMALLATRVVPWLLALIA